LLRKLEKYSVDDVARLILFYFPVIFERTTDCDCEGATALHLAPYSKQINHNRKYKEKIL